MLTLLDALGEDRLDEAQCAVVQQLRGALLAWTEKGGDIQNVKVLESAEIEEAITTPKAESAI